MDSAKITDVINYAAWAESKAIGIRDGAPQGDLRELAHTVVWLADAVKKLGEMAK